MDQLESALPLLGLVSSHGLLFHWCKLVQEDCNWLALCNQESSEMTPPLSINCSLQKFLACSLRALNSTANLCQRCFLLTVFSAPGRDNVWSLQGALRAEGMLFIEIKCFRVWQSGSMTLHLWNFQPDGALVGRLPNNGLTDHEIYSKISFRKDRV